jgi:hypothetical protein
MAFRLVKNKYFTRSLKVPDEATADETEGATAKHVVTFSVHETECK